MNILYQAMEGIARLSVHPVAASVTATYGSSSISKAAGFPLLNPAESESELAPEKPLSCRSSKRLGGPVEVNSGNSASGTSKTGKAIYFDNVSPGENVARFNHEKIFKIVINQNKRKKQVLRGASFKSKKTVLTEYFPFFMSQGSVGNKKESVLVRFKRINGNTKDQEISNFLEKMNYSKGLKFEIIINFNKYIYCPPDSIWESNFLQCIHKGLNELVLVNPDLMAYRMLTCNEFIRYLAFNITDGTKPSVEFRKFDKVEENNIAPFAVLALTNAPGHWDDPLICENLVHTFIHIAHGICLHKLGELFICFQSINNVKKLYEDLCEEPLTLVQLIPRAGAYKPP